MNREELLQKIISANDRLDCWRAKSDDAVYKTPLLRSRTWLERRYSQNRGNHRVFIKLESEQVTGAFKVRGAINCFEAMREGKRKTMVTASTGNHALAVAHALELTDQNGIIFLPETTKQVKLDALEHYAILGRVDIKKIGKDCLESERKAIEYTRKNQDTFYVSPYNDINVVAGQGTIGLEIEQSIKKLDSSLLRQPLCCYVTVGGGGLISGIGTYLKSQKHQTWRVVGCLPENSPVMYESIREGKVVNSNCLDTLSDGSDGCIEDDAVTLKICSEVVDDWILVNENQIANAVVEVFRNHRKVIEGAAGVAVAGYLSDMAWQESHPNSVSVIVACGGNIDPEVFATLLSKA